MQQNITLHKMHTSLDNNNLAHYQLDSIEINNLIGKNQLVRSKIKILHYGYYDEELRRRKYDFLTKLDPNNIDFDGYKHIHSGNSKFAGPDGMEFRSIPELDLQN